MVFVSLRFLELFGDGRVVGEGFGQGGICGL